MNLSEKLRRLAAKLQEDADPILAEAEDSEPTFELVLQAVASSAVSLEGVADLLDKVGASGMITQASIERLGELASRLDRSDDPELQKQASALDELLMTLAAPKNAVAQIKANTEDELKRLREKYKSIKRDELYSGPGEELRKQRQAAQSIKAVEQQVTKRKPMQEPLQTRYSPDMPGTPMIRITDGVYQCSATGKIYNYQAGYTTNKGTQVPGTSVQRQTELNDPMRGHTMFTTRENIMARFTSLSDEDTIKKFAIAMEDPDLQTILDLAEKIQGGVSALPDMKKRQMALTLVIRMLVEMWRNMGLPGDPIVGQPSSEDMPELFPGSVGARREGGEAADDGEEL